MQYFCIHKGDTTLISENFEPCRFTLYVQNREKVHQEVRFRLSITSMKVLAVLEKTLHPRGTKKKSA